MEKTGAPSPPSPPTNLRVLVQPSLNQIQQIADFLKQLNDSASLTEARQASLFAEVSIVRWVARRNRIVFSNALSGPCLTPGKGLEVPYKKPSSPHFVPALYEDDLLGCLTISDVKGLAQYELPTVSTPGQGQWAGTAEVDVTPGGIPRDVYAASVVTEALLFFTLAYFGAFVREDTATSAFPIAGSLFSAFARSRASLGALFIALWSPIVASWLLVTFSMRLPLIVLAVLVSFAALWAQVELYRRSYFQPLLAALRHGRPHSNKTR
jgi:hypothetical protein